MKCWHVISADEDLLSLLEKNCENIQIQTSWKLEPCLTGIDVSSQQRRTEELSSSSPCFEDCRHLSQRGPDSIIGDSSSPKNQIPNSKTEKITTFVLEDADKTESSHFLGKKVREYKHAMKDESSDSVTSKLDKFKQLSILYYNARSLIPKFDELCASIELHNRDVIRIVKKNYFCKLNPNLSKQFWKSIKALNKRPTSVPVLYHGTE